MTYKVPLPNQHFDPDEAHDGIALSADVPIGDKPLDYYKNIAVSVLAQQIIRTIEPEFIEAENFELLRYSVVVIRNGDDGRNELPVEKF